MQNTTSKRILIINDNIDENINGVVTTLNNTKKHLEEKGHIVQFLQPNCFKSVPCPTYPEVRLTINPWKAIQKIKEFNPDCIHISTEGPLGFFIAKYLDYKKLSYTTAYHTKLPEYVNARFPWIPVELVYSYMRFFHKNSKNILVTTNTMYHSLDAKGFRNLVVWYRGVDVEKFTYSEVPCTPHIKVLYVGRISVEKNLEVLLDCPIHNIGIDLVGDGPDMERLMKKYKHKKNIRFHGFKTGNQLVQYYRSADVFAFPSKTDTFGLVMLEAMACGTPVAAYPVPGPIDVVVNGINGYLSDNLADAIMKAYIVPRTSCRAFAEEMSWGKTTDTFLNAMVRLDDGQKLIPSEDTRPE